MASNPNRASSGAPKRRSTLAELGIKPNGATVAPSPSPSPKKPSPEPTTAAKRGITATRASKTPATRPRPLSMAGTPTSSSALSSSGHRTAPSSPTVQRSASKQSPATVRKTPAAINTAKASIGNAAGAPKTPTPTTAAAARRRSMVSTSTSSSSQAPVSPLLRRGSTTKRMSSPAGPSPSPSSSSSKRAIEQLRELQKKLADKEKELEEKDLMIHELQMKMTDLSVSDKSSDPATPLLSSSSMLIPCDSSVESEREKILHDDVDKIKNEYQHEIESIRKQLKQAQEEKEAVTVEAKDQETLKIEIRRQVDEEVSVTHKNAMDVLVEEQERKWQSEIQAIRSDHEKALTQLEANHIKQLSDIEHDFQGKLKIAEEEKGKVIQELQGRIEDLEKILDDSRNVNNLRRLERQIAENQSEFDEYKRQAAQEKETLERRYRDEMQQLQSGNDDTAEVWLGKNRAAQQEIDRLQASAIDLERKHAAKLQDIKDEYDEQINDWAAKCETQESEIDSQAHQIESLLTQIDDLQNSLEAATKRLERSTTKKQQQMMEPSISDEASHRQCEEKLQTRKLEVDELHRRISELKRSNEAQLNRLGHEKARELQELRKEMLAVQDLLKTTKQVSDERFSSIAQQHKKEIHVMHEQYQKLVDIKDRELEDYAYRVKAIAATKQKEMDRVREESNEKISEIEDQIEGYETRIHQFERQTEELQQKCVVQHDENAQLSRLIQQLQGELHRGDL